MFNLFNYLKKRIELEFVNLNYRDNVHSLSAIKETFGALENDLYHLENDPDGRKLISHILTKTIAPMMKQLEEYKSKLQKISEYFKKNEPLQPKNQYISGEVNALRKRQEELIKRYGSRAEQQFNS
jgi:hypothetical protein